MAQFSWVAAPDHGFCLGCMAGTSEDGFVDLIGETTLKDDRGEVQGVLDVVYCSTCIQSAAKLVGSADKFDTLEMVNQIIELTKENERLKDEISARDQRFDQMRHWWSGEEKPDALVSGTA